MLRGCFTFAHTNMSVMEKISSVLVLILVLRVEVSFPMRRMNPYGRPLVPTTDIRLHETERLLVPRPPTSNGGLQVCNATPLAIHVAFVTIGPLFYENWLRPGQCMTRNNIGNWWRDIEIRTALQTNEFSDNDNIRPWVEFGATCLSTITVARGIRILKSVGFSKAMSEKIYSTILSVVGSATGTWTLLDLISKMEGRHQGYFSNCKTWRVRGGPHPTWTADGTLFGNPADPRGEDYKLEGGHHYDCQTPGVDFQVNFPTVPPP
jgi:hypothetical protein